MHRETRLGRTLCLLVLLLLGLADPGTAQEVEFDPGALDWRPIGPAVTGGRIVDFAVVEEDPDVFWTATASGGIWKTENGGATWEAQFDRQERVAIGGIAVAPSNPNVVWVGTGEPNARNLRSSSWGNGVYRSRDGGKSWRHMGLEGSQQIGRVRVDPRDENVVYVSVLGSMWHDEPAKGEVRGLWKTTDGGESWSKVLDTGPRAGVVELAQDLSRPDRLYAASWERERTDWSFVGRGPGSGIYASRDSGDSWERLGNGLPEVDLGRVGLSICRSAPDVVYAVIDAAAPHGGLYRSDDGGASWEHRSDAVGASMYYGQVRCDPTDPERLYVLQTRMSISDDGGRTFSTDIPDSSVHVDHHALWIDPSQPEHLLLGNDGGVYQSRDRGRTWRFAPNLPITQFYTVAVDRRRPDYRVYGGTQDNNSLGGPSGTRNRSGIVNADWYVTVGGDGFFLQIDTAEPDTVYTEWQYGNLIRFDAETGERKSIQPDPPEGDSHRWNWSAPLLLSEHGEHPLYFGSQYLFRSTDRGDSWQMISPDLTRAIEIPEETRISDYGTLRVIAESPLEAGLLAVGSDDGLVQISENGGETWRRAAAFPDTQESWQVVRVVLSAHERDRLYAAVSGHEWDDFRPYLLRSEDLGASWERIDTGLPEDAPIRAFAEHPAEPDLLWVGTEFGVHATFDGGASWRDMGANLPTVPVHDLLIHPYTHDVVLGTHGRGFWILDDTGSLAALASLSETDRGRVLGVRQGIRLIDFDRGKRNQGAVRYEAPNPPRGVLIDVWLPAETAADLRITTPDDRTVRRLELEPGAAGLRRVEWDLRTDPLYEPPGEDWGRSVVGPRVVAGEYRIVLETEEGDEAVAAGVLPDPDADVAPADRRLQFSTATEAGRLLGRAYAAAGTSARLRADLQAAREALAETDEAALLERVSALLAEAEGLQGRLEGSEAVEDPIVRGLAGVYRSVEGSQARPTEADLATLEGHREALTAVLEDLRPLRAGFEELAAAMDAAGIRWTPGRAVRSVGESR